MRIGAQKIQRCLKESAPVLFVGHTVGGHQSERLARFQAVVVDAVQHGILILGRQAAQGVSHRGTELSLRECVFCQGRESCGDIPTAGYPRGFSAQQAGDGGGAETVFAEQGIDHTPLVQRGEGAGRRVGCKKQALVFFGGAGAFQHDRNELESALAPGGEAFEAIDDLIAAVGGGDDAEGQLRGVVGQMGGSPRAQRGVAGPKPLDGEQAEGSCLLDRRGSTRRSRRGQTDGLWHGESHRRLRRGAGRPQQEGRTVGRRRCGAWTDRPSSADRP